MCRMKRSILAVFGIAACAAFAPASTYQWDDGVPEGSPIGNTNTVVAVAYEALAGFTTIGNIEVFNYSPAWHGKTISYHLWKDTGLGFGFLDAQLLRTTTTTVNSPQTTGGNWQTVNIAPITLNVGDTFYVGVSIAETSSANLLGRDETPPAHGRSWFASWSSGPANPNNIGSANIVFNSAGSDYMIRANAVPEPVSMLTLLGGVAAVALRRRKKQSS